MVSASSLLAGLAFFLFVPGSIALAYLGYSRGFYSYGAIPAIVAGILVVGFTALFLVLPRLRD